MGVTRISALSLLAVLAAACATREPPSGQTLSYANVLGRWELIEVGSRKVTGALLLNFDPRGSVTGQVRCNDLSGRYFLLSNRITFEDAIITTGGCSPSWPDNRALAKRAEEILFSPTARAWLSADGHSLIVSGSDTLRFRRAP